MKNPWQVLRGGERLWIVFWIYCVLGTGLAIELPILIDRPLVLRDAPLSLFIAVGVLQLIYLCWAHLSLWSCAFNAGRRWWGYAARTYLLLVIAGWVVYPNLQAWQGATPTLEVLMQSDGSD